MKKLLNVLTLVTFICIAGAVHAQEGAALPSDEDVIKKALGARSEPLKLISESLEFNDPNTDTYPRTATLIARNADSTKFYNVTVTVSTDKETKLVPLSKKKKTFQEITETVKKVVFDTEPQEIKNCPEEIIVQQDKEAKKLIKNALEKEGKSLEYDHDPIRLSTSDDKLIYLIVAKNQDRTLTYVGRMQIVGKVNLNSKSEIDKNSVEKVAEKVGEFEETGKVVAVVQPEPEKIIIKEERIKSMAESGLNELYVTVVKDGAKTVVSNIELGAGWKTNDSVSVEDKIVTYHLTVKPKHHKIDIKVKINFGKPDEPEIKTISKKINFSEDYLTYTLGKKITTQDENDVKKDEDER